MWTANAATIAPSVDTADGKVHITPANLAHNLHRSIEAETTAHILRYIFSDANYFAHHSPLFGAMHYGDEGAANHGRLAVSHGAPGMHLFVYGEDGDRFPARQKLRASEAVARHHQLNGAHVVFAKQSKTALDAGAFHNDVVSVPNGNVLFFHEASFEDREGTLAAILEAHPEALFIEAKSLNVSLSDVVSSYLFNSQLLTLPDGEMALILPEEVRENANTYQFVEDSIEADNPIKHAEFLDVRESMRNGGGPACLRLRVVLSDVELSAISQNFILDDRKSENLENWVEKFYRDRLSIEDLADPNFAVECFEAIDALTVLLEMGTFYDFQRV